MKETLYVKTYDLCDGEIAIGEVKNIIEEDKNIAVWFGVDMFIYEDETEPRIIKPNTMIWDKREKRYVFSYCEKMREGYACFSTIVVDKSRYIEALLISDEKVKYYWD